MDYESVETVEDCREIALVDAYGAYEQACAWQTYLTDLFAGRKATLMGQSVKIKQFLPLGEGAVVAQCRNGKYSAQVTIDSLEWPSLEDWEQLWIKAYLKWQI